MMADIRCPMCSKLNPDTLPECQYCGARLKPVGDMLADSGETIRPGDEPTKKSTAELEKALPDWLRNLRQGDESGQAENQPDGDAFFPESAAQAGQDDLLGRLSGAESQDTGDIFTPSVPASGDLLAGLAASQEEDEELPDWLASIQGQVAESSQGFEAPSGELTSQIDWLSQLDAEEKPAKPVSEESPAWSGFLGETEPQIFTEPEQAQLAGEETDWFAAPSEEKPFELFTPSETTDTPDWLRELETSQPSGQKPEQAPLEQDFIPSDDMPDWLRGLDDGTKQGQDSAAQVAIPAFSETPDWLGGNQVDQPTLSETPASETFDWLGESAASQPGVQQVGSDESSDWLSGVLPDESTPLQQGETPDWLSDLQPAQPAAEQAPAGDIPDWLGDLQTGVPSLPGEEQVAPPDWLKDFSTQPSFEQMPEQGFASSPETPDWLANLEPSQPGEETPVSTREISFEEKPVSSSQPEPAPFAEDTIPDWLAGAATVGASLGGLAAGKDETQPAEPDLFADLGGETPDWLADIAKEQPIQAESVPFTQAETASQSQSGTDEVLPWLSESAPLESGGLDTALPAFVGDKDASGALLGMEMPDWLSGIEAPESGISDDKTPAQVAEESLMPSELPSWVQAMRPVESILSETEEPDEEQFVESQGPLAGMRNVLPVVTGLIAVRKPAPYSSKLQVNEVQQSNAALLESMLTPRADGVKRGQAGKSMRLLRWAIALVLVVVVALPIFFESQSLTPTANLIAPEMNAAYQIVDSLPENALVLTVFDYEPSFSGEMATVATPLLDHLMLKNARLVIVSSLPTGSTQAEQLLATALFAHQYQMGSQYINLGYVPGGAAGISTFASDPTHTIQVDVANTAIWQDPNSFLAGQGSLNTYDAMVIITDNSDTGRIWIEQARSPLGSVPLLFAISAQAEPMLRPYYDSGQIQGMVTGLAGGASYENVSGRLGLGRAYWDAFSVAFLIAEVIVVVGGIWALIAAWRARTSQKDRA